MPKEESATRKRYQAARDAAQLLDDAEHTDFEPVRNVVRDICGMVYNGDVPNGILECIRWMRANPEEAKELLK